MTTTTGFYIKVYLLECRKWAPADRDQKTVISLYIDFLYRDHKDDWENLCQHGTILGRDYRGTRPLPPSKDINDFTINLAKLHEDRYTLSLQRPRGKVRKVEITPLFGEHIDNPYFVPLDRR
jgi:hypothetical protein